MAKRIKLGLLVFALTMSLLAAAAYAASSWS